MVFQALLDLESVGVEIFRLRGMQELVAEIDRDIVGHAVAGSRCKGVGEAILVVRPFLVDDAQRGRVDPQIVARIEEADAAADIGRDADDRAEIGISVDETAPGRLGEREGIDGILVREAVAAEI